MKKIAVATDDRINLALHFGRAHGFLIFSVNGDTIEHTHYVDNTFTGHMKNHHHSNQGHHHSHSSILHALNDVNVIISHGMGHRMMNDFEKHGKEVFITSAPTAKDAVLLYLNGDLQHFPDRSCQADKETKR